MSEVSLESTDCSASGVSAEVTDGSEVSKESEGDQLTEEVDKRKKTRPSDVKAAAGGLHASFSDNNDDVDDDAVPSNEFCVGNTEGENDLMRSIRANDCDMIQMLVQNGLDCNTVCKWDGPACSVSVQREDFRKQLQMMGYAALHVAAIHSSLKTLRCLLSLGADINQRDKNERTALQLATVVNRPGVVRCLIDAGADINTRSVSGRSPLMEAVLNVSLDLTRILLAAGANTELTDIKGTTPLYAVVGVMAGRLDPERGQAIIQCLIDAGCEVNRTTPAGASALMLAAGLKNTSVIHMLIAAGAQVNQTDRAGRTPLHVSTDGQRNLSAVKALMRYGAATHIADTKGQTILDRCLKFGSVSLLRLLLSADAVPHTYDILTAPRIIQLRQYLPEFDTWLQGELYEPRTLRRLCREVIRVHLSPHNLPQVKDLGLPHSLNSYVLGETD